MLRNARSSSRSWRPDGPNARGYPSTGEERLESFSWQAEGKTVGLVRTSSASRRTSWERSGSRVGVGSLGMLDWPDDGCQTGTGTPDTPPQTPARRAPPPSANPHVALCRRLSLPRPTAAATGTRVSDGRRTEIRPFSSRAVVVARRVRVCIISSPQAWGWERHAGSSPPHPPICFVCNGIPCIY